MPHRYASQCVIGQTDSTPKTQPIIVPLKQRYSQRLQDVPVLLNTAIHSAPIAQPAIVPYNTASHSAPITQTSPAPLRCARLYPVTQPIIVLPKTELIIVGHRCSSLHNIDIHRAPITQSFITQPIRVPHDTDIQIAPIDVPAFISEHSHPQGPITDINIATILQPSTVPLNTAFNSAPTVMPTSAPIA